MKKYTRPKATIINLSTESMIAESMPKDDTGSEEQWTQKQQNNGGIWDNWK